jgi:anti-sigma regulatory factor (Ser/Thr protein kinase)
VCGDAAVLRIGVALDELSRLYPWLDSAAAARAVPAPIVQKMQVALEEAVMNVAMHAYGPGGDGAIAIRLLAQDDAVALVIEDTGPAFDPTTAVARAAPLSLEDARPGGLGLKLLRHFCPDIEYQRVDDRNCLTLRFPISTGGHTGNRQVI